MHGMGVFPVIMPIVMIMVLLIVLFLIFGRGGFRPPWYDRDITTAVPGSNVSCDASRRHLSYANPLWMSKSKPESQLCEESGQIC